MTLFIEVRETTVHASDADACASVRHVIVGRAISLRREGGYAEVVPPTDLPDCDILALNCEDTEIDIFEEMEIRLRAVVVETHGMYGALESRVRDLLTQVGHKTIETGVAEERLRDVCKENGIYVPYGVFRESGDQ